MHGKGRASLAIRTSRIGSSKSISTHLLDGCVIGLKKTVQLQILIFYNKDSTCLNAF